MRLLRLLLAVGCVGATLWAAGCADWEAHVTPSFDDAVMPLGRHPLWEPPETPEVFRVYTRSHRTESRPIRPGDVVTVRVSPAHVAIDATVLAWPTLGLVGVLYLTLRGRRRNLALHCAGVVALGQVVALIACVASLPLWIPADNWLYSPYHLFAVCSLGGLIVGCLTYSPAVVGGPRYLRSDRPTSTATSSASRKQIPSAWPGFG